jgi:hypothetical protein
MPLPFARAESGESKGYVCVGETASCILRNLAVDSGKEFVQNNVVDFAAGAGFGGGVGVAVGLDAEGVFDVRQIAPTVTCPRNRLREM